jgi:glycosidase
MWGADDPDDRKPLVWADLKYEEESTHPLGGARRADPVAPDTALFRTYQDLIRLRKQHIRLFGTGSLRWLRTDDGAGVLVYERVLDGQRAVVAFNLSDRPREVEVEAEGRYREAFPGGGDVSVASGALSARLEPRSAKVWTGARGRTGS